jgi:hypothetical protein
VPPLWEGAGTCEPVQLQLVRLHVVSPAPCLVPGCPLCRVCLLCLPCIAPHPPHAAPPHTHAAVLRVFARERNLPALVHCAHGKDRTGVVIMLLLMVCGVPHEAIVGDYVQVRGRCRGEGGHGGGDAAGWEGQGLNRRETCAGEGVGREGWCCA